MVDPSIESFEVDVMASATVNSSDSDSVSLSFISKGESINFDELHQMDEVKCYLRHHIFLPEKWTFVKPDTAIRQLRRNFLLAGVNAKGLIL
jgi:hypothetical protein